MISREMLHILQHSIGVNQYGEGAQYRNHFVTGEGTTDYPHCLALVEFGLMENRGSNALTGRGECFVVTRAGKDYVSKNSPQRPPAPKLTRSQKRYCRYLEYGDMFDSFREFLAWDAEPERQWNNA